MERDSVAADDGQDRWTCDGLPCGVALQVAAGARRFRLLDSWWSHGAGRIYYVRVGRALSRAMIERIRSTGVPVNHFGTRRHPAFFRELHAARKTSGVMAHQNRSGLDGYQLPLGDPGDSDPTSLFGRMPSLKCTSPTC